MNLRDTAECAVIVALSLLAELCVRVAFRLAKPETLDRHFSRLPHIEARSFERAYRNVLDSHDLTQMMRLFEDDSVRLTRQLIVLGADPRIGHARTVSRREIVRFETMGHFRAVYEAGAFRSDRVRQFEQDRILHLTVERDNLAMCEELIRLVGSPVDYETDGEHATLWEYAVFTSGAASLCYAAMQAFPTAEFPRFSRMPDAWHDGKTTEEMCVSRDKKLLADIAIGLIELGLPVNLLVQIFAVHLASCHNSVSLVVQWEIGKRVKHFMRQSLRRSERIRLRERRVGAT